MLLIKYISRLFPVYFSVLFTHGQPQQTTALRILFIRQNVRTH